MTRKILEDKFLSKISYGPTTSQKAGYVPARVLVSSACFTSQNQEQAHDSIASENEGFFVALFESYVKRRLRLLSGWGYKIHINCIMKQLFDGNITLKVGIETNVKDGIEIILSCGDVHCCMFRRSANNVPKCKTHFRCLQKSLLLVIKCADVWRS